jgi:hypothetical protein
MYKKFYKISKLISNKETKEEKLNAADPKVVAVVWVFGPHTSPPNTLAWCKLVT